MSAGPSIMATVSAASGVTMTENEVGNAGALSPPGGSAEGPGTTTWVAALVLANVEIAIVVTSSSVHGMSAVRSSAIMPAFVLSSALFIATPAAGSTPL